MGKIITKARRTAQKKKTGFEERTAKLYGVTVPKVSEMMVGSQYHTIRINRLKVSSRDDFIEAASNAGLDCHPLFWYPDGLVFKRKKGDLLNSSLITEGIGFIQNASSFIPVLALQPQENEDILDVCAAPGAKSSMIAALTNNKSRLWLNDGIVTRIDKIKDVKNVLDFEIANMTSHPGQYIDKYIDHSFDRILLDAQCSGEGNIDFTKPGNLRHWSTGRIKKYNRLQTKMLSACFKLLKPGGTMVYSTYTLAPEENEDPVSTLLKRCNDAVIEPIKLRSSSTMKGVKEWKNEKYHPSLKGALRVIPGGREEYMGSVFACRIRKLSDDFTKKSIKTIDIAKEGMERSLPFGPGPGL